MLLSLSLTRPLSSFSLFFKNCLGADPVISNSGAASSRGLLTQISFLRPDQVFGTSRRQQHDACRIHRDRPLFPSQPGDKTDDGIIAF